MKYTCIDSFCGAGGLGLGLLRAGFDILLSFDIEPKCIQTLALNKKYINHNIEVADINNMLNGALLQKCGLSRGELFLLAGGPPCQGFSVLRHGEINDPRNQLVLSYAKLIDELYPFYFVMENVSGLGGKRGRAVLDELVTTVEKIGYNVHVRQVDAQTLGVPQRRRRYIIVGERKDLGNNYEYPKDLGIRKTVRDTIGSLPTPPLDGTDHPSLPLHRRDKLSPTNLLRIRSIQQGQSSGDIPMELRANSRKPGGSGKGFPSVYGRMSWDDVAPTITARFDSFTRGKFGHPEDDRTISLREGALLQTFPMDYVFTGNKVDIARQIGNAVPPQMATCIGQSIISSYEKSIKNCVSKTQSTREE